MNEKNGGDKDEIVEQSKSADVSVNDLSAKGPSACISDLEKSKSDPKTLKPIKKSLKATWTGALLTFFAPFLIAFCFRWIVFEPYVIPSGSMIPTLLIHDHILVNKWVYGWRWPFSEKWLYFWNKPSAGEIVVFKFPLGKDVYYIKRIVATEGEEISVINGQLIRNGTPIDRKALSEGDLVKIGISTNEDFSLSYGYFQEAVGGHSFVSRSATGGRLQDYGPMKIPPGHFFVVGDNRDESSDSRSWGFVPYENLMGRAWFIWLSCTDTLPASPMLCDPNTIRWPRIFSKIQK
jgi:signal peptidase I